MKITLLSSAVLSLVSLAHASTVFTATNATYAHSGNPTTNLSGNSNNYVTHSGASFTGVAFYNFDISSYADSIDDIDITLTQNDGDSLEEFRVYYYDTAIDLTALTYDSAVSDGYLDGSGAATGSWVSSLSGFNLITSGAADTSKTVNVNLGDITSDLDGVFTLAVAGVGTSATSASFSDAATLTLSTTVVPEPSSVALLGLGGVALVSRRRR